MTILWLIVAFLVVAGSVLAMAEAAISRMSRVRAYALREEGRRNADILVRIEEDPPRYLNSVYLSVMFTQNGSAVVVALLADRLTGDFGVTLITLAFTLAYFVVVEAMSKTFAILHNHRVALAVAPLVFFLARLLSLPTKLLISLSNALLPGKGLKEGPFVSEEDIRSMAEVGHEEGAIEEEEKDLIHSIFEFTDTTTREVMVPRPDVTMVGANKTLNRALDICLKHGYSRIPVFDKEPDNVVGIVYAKDLFKAIRRNGDSGEMLVATIMRKPYFVPESKSVAALLREMQLSRVHMAIVVDEFGDVAGLVTLEDLIEEIVGEIDDEYDTSEPDIVAVDETTWRVKGKVAISELNEHLDTELPDEEEWTTVGGLMSAALGRLPEQGDDVEFQGLSFRAEKVNGRRLGTVLVTRVSQDVAS